MSYLTLTPNGGGSPTTIRVLVASPPSHAQFEVGNLTPAFDGTPHDSRRGRKNRWTGVSTIVPNGDVSTLRSLLEGTQPLTANGDMTGSSVAVYVTAISVSPVTALHSRVQFDLWGTS